MSGLETAIRNALDRSDRADGQTRARIYQSARQALDAGLRRQGVSDALIIMQQQKRLEEKIREIEAEETERLAQADARQAQDPEVFAVEPEPVGERRLSSEQDEIILDGETRRPAGRAVTQGEATLDPSFFGAPEGVTTVGLRPADRGAQAPAGKRRGGRTGKLDVPVEPAAKPRRRRTFLSRLMTWVITLVVVGIACWWFYQSGMVQSVVQEAIRAADRASQGAARGGTSFDPRGGFSDEWTEIFKPSDVKALKLGSQARAETVDGSEGQAVQLVSTAPGEEGDIAIEVPVDVLREMAAKSSTIALTVQSGVNQAVQMAVRCDFGSLGTCSRHRFTATQERLEALFNVSFDKSIAPNSPGRLIINAGIDGADKPVLLYSVRILPGH